MPQHIVVSCAPTTWLAPSVLIPLFAAGVAVLVALISLKTSKAAQGSAKAHLLGATREDGRLFAPTLKRQLRESIFRRLSDLRSEWVIAYTPDSDMAVYALRVLEPDLRITGELKVGVSVTIEFDRDLPLLVARANQIVEELADSVPLPIMRTDRVGYIHRFTAISGEKITLILRTFGEASSTQIEEAARIARPLANIRIATEGGEKRRVRATEPHVRNGTTWNTEWQTCNEWHYTVGQWRHLSADNRIVVEVQKGDAWLRWYAPPHSLLAP